MAGQQFPEELDCILDLQNSAASCCQFNRWGTLVAVGCSDGRVFIVDFITKNTVKVWTAHDQPVVGISWSRDGRKLLTCSFDQTIAVWDVLTCHIIQQIRFNTNVTFAMFNPRDDNKVIVLRANNSPTVEQISPRNQTILTNDTPGSVDDVVCALTYDRKAKYIITGTRTGKLIIYDAETLNCVSWCRQKSSQQIQQIIVPSKSDFIITNSQDGIIRVYNMTDLLSLEGSTIDAQYKIQDMIKNTVWKSICTDSDGKYICAASTKTNSLYIWESSTGNLLEVLHGTEGNSPIDVQWHPTKPSISSIAQDTVSLWRQTHVENWSAFASGIRSLEENEKYQEKYGDFDLEDEDADEIIEEDQDEDSDIDVENLDLEDDSDEEDFMQMKLDCTLRTGPLWYIPIEHDVDDSESQP